MIMQKLKDVYSLFGNSLRFTSDIYIYMYSSYYQYGGETLKPFFMNWLGVRHCANVTFMTHLQLPHPSKAACMFQKYALLQGLKTVSQCGPC